MDVALRALREGRGDAAAAAPLLLLVDELGVAGGPALLRHAVSELAAAIAGGRAHASALCVLALERPATQYAQLCSLASVSLTVVDGFSDAHGWGSLVGGRQGAPGPAASSSTGVAIVPLPGLLASPGSLQLLQQRLLTTLSSGGGRHCLVVDSLSPLLDAAGPAAVARLLHALQAAPSVSCLLCGVHADLHPPAALAALEQLAAGTLQLQGASDLERSLCRATGGPAGEPQGRLAVRLKRASGRVRAEAQLYCLDAAGGAVFLKPPADALNPQAAAAEKAGSAGGTGGDATGALAQQLAGGMRMGLTPAELAAKQRVQLPFEHQGQGAAYQTGDFRDYLPPEAGGRAGSRPHSALSMAAGGAAAAAGDAQRLGHILYVRDSSSDHDSDEDPDDDLDI